jgi:signal transduction histidine kinase
MKRAGEGAQLSVPELPANPRVLSQLLSTLGESGATSSSLGRVILTDPALTLAVLRAVLAGTGFPDPSRGFSMEACVDALGRDLLQAYTLLRATRQVAAGLTDTTPGPLTQTWRHSLVCAHAAAALARAASKPEQECYLAGLLCDIGTLARQGTGATAPVRAPAPHELSWADSEATVMVLAETDGAWIGRGWLPPFVADALRLRKESAEVLADAPFVVRALKVALALADGGASETARKLGKDLLGLDEQDITRAAETAVAAARELHLGLEPARDTGATDILAGTWDTAPSAAATSPAPGDAWIDLGEAVGEAAFRQILYQALAAAGNGQGVLERLRRAWRLLTRLEQHYFFMADAQGTTLNGTPLAGDAPELAELRVETASSRSLIAEAVREKRLVHAFGARVTEKGSALDRVLARMLGSDGLLCLPLLVGPRLQGVAVFGLASEWSEEQAAEGALLARLAASAGAAVMRAEQAREQQERMRNALTAQFQALGKRVVHEAANPLSVVKNYLKVLGNKLGDAHRFGEELGILNEELDRIGRIVQRMGAPFTVETGEAARVDLNATVKEVMTLASETLTAGRGIEVQQQLDPRIPVLQGDAVGLKQVVLNLLTNAVEAMPDGGRLTIVTADNVNLSGEPFVLLQVTDTGKGMAPESMRRLFQAGFSTKGEGHEGIGLSVSESIVRGMGGRILCRSHEGRGTIFVVLLPRRAAGESGAGSAPAPG